MAKASSIRDIHKAIAGAGFAAFPVYVNKSWNQSGATTATIPVFRAPQKMRLLAGTFVQDNDTDGDKVIKVRNLTKTVDQTANLDVDALAADAGADFVLTTVAADLVVNKGDIIGVVYTVTTAGVVQPGEVNVVLKYQLL